MENLFENAGADAFVAKYLDYPKDLALRAYTSRLIGRESSLVLHGGGNTSVKLRIRNIVGKEEDVLFIKGSGRDLANIDPDGFTGLRLEPLRELLQLHYLSDDHMDNLLKVHRIDAEAPFPSIETLLHAFLPHRFVDHTHADILLVLSNQDRGEEFAKEVLGDKIAIIPYTMSGFPMAKAVKERFERDPAIEGILFLNHGIFTFADEASTSYERMIDYVSRAEAYVQERIKGGSTVSCRTDMVAVKDIHSSLARCAQVIRGTCAHRDPETGILRRFYVESRQASDLVEASISERAEFICGSGVLTPDHVIRTKNNMLYIEHIPASDEDLRAIVNQRIEKYADEYHRYFQYHLKAKNVERKELDPFPRLFLVAGLGIMGLGLTRKAARIAADIGEHTIRAKVQASALGRYVPVSESHVFDIEYWRLQQKKLGSERFPILQGQIALVTGGGGAIGLGIADRLVAAGAAVVLCDIDNLRLQKVHSILTNKYDKNLVDMLVLDVTDYESMSEAYEEISLQFGGIDLVVPTAGIAHVDKIENLNETKLEQVLNVNLMGTFNTIKASIPTFRRQGTGGNIVVVSSKNVFDPGFAFAAYSSSKAGAHQISKIAALELAELGVRVNMLNPDAIFGYGSVPSGFWELVGPAKMKSRGFDYEGLKAYYRNRNLLKTEILANHVGNAVVFFASNQTPTTGASLPIDGGIPAAFPR